MSPLKRVTFLLPDGTRRQVSVREDQHILEAALDAGLDLPYSCLQGWCLTCAARLAGAGRVDQQDSRRYYETDREAGFVLPCTGRAETDLVLQTHAREAMRESRALHHLPFPRGNWGHDAAGRGTEGKD